MIERIIPGSMKIWLRTRIREVALSWANLPVTLLKINRLGCNSGRLQTHLEAQLF